MTVRCPDCGEEIELPPGAKSGDLLDCPIWQESDGDWTLVPIRREAA